MISQKTSISTLALLAVLTTTAVMWSGDIRAQDQAQAQIYGSQLMTDAERTEYHSKMRALKTDRERDTFRLDHHESMKVRAAEKGVTLPNTSQGVGSKANSGFGGGPGSGSGAGQGGSMNAPSGGGRGGR